MRQSNLKNYIVNIFSFFKIRIMEKTLKITDEQAKELYPQANVWFKKILEINFGKKIFCKNFQDAVKSYEDACHIADEKPIDEKLLANMGLSKSDIAFIKLKTIYKAANILNDNWEADWNNSDQYKYYPWFAWRSSGFRYYATYYTYTYTLVGSRLCCGIREDAEYIGKQFEELYNDYFS